MIKALRNKKTGILFPILSPEEHSGGVEGYEYNRPSDKWELVRINDKDKVWMGNNPEFVEVVQIDD